MSSSKKKVLVAWLPMLLWLGVIATESTATFSGSRTTLWIYRALSHFFHHITLAQVVNVNLVLRKSGHFLGYAALSWFAFRGWMETFAYRREQWMRRHGRPDTPARRWHLRAAVLAVLVTMAVAALDEFHQSMLPARTGTVRDAVLDTMGGVFAQTILLLYWTNRKGRQAASGERGGNVQKRPCRTAVSEKR